MKTSAGAPDSICFASALLAPYETTTLWLVAALKALPCSSIASLRLAAAKTVTSAAPTGGAGPAAATIASDHKKTARQRMRNLHGRWRRAIYLHIYRQTSCVKTSSLLGHCFGDLYSQQYHIAHGAHRESGFAGLLDGSVCGRGNASGGRARIARVRVRPARLASLGYVAGLNGVICEHAVELRKQRRVPAANQHQSRVLVELRRDFAR